MPKASNPFSMISLHPVAGLLDTRSRPADLAPGAYRRREWFAMNDEGKTCRAEGFERAFAPAEGNYDYHHVGGTREPITTLFESTDTDGVRRLFEGTATRFSSLDESTGEWTKLLSGVGAPGAVWSVAQLKNTLVATNDVDHPKICDVTVGTMTDAGNLTSVVGVTKAKLAFSWNGHVFVANLYQADLGARYATRVRWCDLDDPTQWDPSATDSVAGFQDLPYGDDILAAAPIRGAMYLFTRRSIWAVSVSGDVHTQFTFVRLYTEPKNETGCLAYPRTLVSTGGDLWYMSRDGIYRWNSFLAEPIREDWVHRASGVIYKKTDTRFDGSSCYAPCAEYRPDVRELHISWPGPGSLQINDHELVLRLDKQAADVRSEGYTAYVNYRHNPLTGLCNEAQDLLAASGKDFCIKSIGGVFYLEMADLVDDDRTQDLPTDATYTKKGYYSRLTGTVPTGLYDREKMLRMVRLLHDTSEEDPPCKVRLRVGQSDSNVDPVDEDDVCAPLWGDYADRPLSCPEPITLSAMKAAATTRGVQLRPSPPGTQWPVWMEAVWIYWDLVIANQDNSAAIGGDSCFQSIDFDVASKPNP